MTLWPFVFIFPSSAIPQLKSFGLDEIKKNSREFGEGLEGGNRTAAALSPHLNWPKIELNSGLIIKLPLRKKQKQRAFGPDKL
jgi:hypothetical protein